jgi:hypothetical protein
MAEQVYDFVIALKRPSYKAINAVSVGLIVIFLAVFCFCLYRLGLFRQNWLMSGIPLIVLGTMTSGFLNARKPDFLLTYRLELTIAGMGFVALEPLPHHQLWAALYLLLAVAERLAKQPLEYYFCDTHIVKKGVMRKTYQWYEVENVRISHNLFTLDLRDNRLVQKRLQQDTDPQTEAEFNAFCKAQLHFNPQS